MNKLRLLLAISQATALVKLVLKIGNHACLMPKLHRPWWILQGLMEAVIKDLAPSVLAVRVYHIPDDVTPDDECEGIASARWCCDYDLPFDEQEARTLIPILDEAISRWQARFNMAVSYERIA